MSIVQKIKELQAAIKEEFPEGGVSISVVAVDATSTLETEIIEDKPVFQFNPEDFTIDKLKTLLNGYARKHGLDATFELIVALTGGSKKPEDIPKEHWAIIAEKCMTEGTA